MRNDGKFWNPPKSTSSEEIPGLVPVLGRVKALKRGRTENRSYNAQGWGLKMCDNPHARWEKGEIVSRHKNRSPELLSQNDVALLDMEKKTKNKKPCGWRLASNAAVKFIKIIIKKNHQGRKLSMDTSFPAISALQPSCASALTVTICWNKFPRVRRNDGIPPMHRYLRSPR